MAAQKGADGGARRLLCPAGRSVLPHLAGCCLCVKDVPLSGSHVFQLLCQVRLLSLNLVHGVSGLREFYFSTF